MERDLILSALNTREDTDICISNSKTAHTYGELKSDVSKTIQYFKSLQIGSHSKVVIAVPASYEFLVVFYALYQSEATMALIDPQMGKTNYYALCSQFKPDILVVDSRLLLLNEHPIAKWIITQLNKFLPAINFKTIQQIITTGRDLPILRKHHKLSKRHSFKSLPIETNPVKTEIITYTSGTLSMPKGVVHKASSLIPSLSIVSNLLIKTRDKRLATHLPHFMLIFTHFGGETYLWSEHLDGKQRFSFIEKNQITTLFGPPSELQLLINYCNESHQKLPACLQHIILGSAPVYTSFLEKLLEITDAKVNCLYGMTENLVVSIADAREKLNYHGDGDYVGEAAPGVNIKINEDHEILIQSPQLFSAYFAQPHRTNWHATGDLGKLENEKLILIGRKKDMIIRRNKNIYPGLYEPVINQIPFVDEATMVGYYDETIQDEQLILVVDSSEKINTEKLMKMISKGPYQIDNDVLPDKIIQHKIPKMGRQQKVDKVRLREMVKILCL